MTRQRSSIVQNATSSASHSGPTDVVSEFGRMASTGTRQLATAVVASQPLLEAYIGLLRTVMALPALAMSSVSSVSSMGRPVMASVMPGGSCCDCEIPETDCPPYCVCEIAWEGAPGDKLKATIQLTNTRQAAQQFVIGAGPFRGPSGNTGAAVSPAPAAVNLPANQSTTIVVTFQVPATFTAGSIYSSEMTVTGLYEQCVKVTLRVRATPPEPHCDVKQGEIPKRIRAHHWYEHFQCEEPCFEPAKPRTGGTVPHVPHQPA
jgi:hypothetical protein